MLCKQAGNEWPVLLVTLLLMAGRTETLQLQQLKMSAQQGRQLLTFLRNADGAIVSKPLSVAYK